MQFRPPPRYRSLLEDRASFIWLVHGQGQVGSFQSGATLSHAYLCLEDTCRGHVCTLHPSRSAGRAHVMYDLPRARVLVCMHTHSHCMSPWWCNCWIRGHRCSLQSILPKTLPQSTTSPPDFILMLPTTLTAGNTDPQIPVWHRKNRGSERTSDFYKVRLMTSGSHGT